MSLTMSWSLSLKSMFCRDGFVFLLREQVWW